MAFDANWAVVKRRRVIHFTGFEPLDFLAHKSRYERALAKSAWAFGFNATIKPKIQGNHGASFSVHANGSNWQTDTTITLLDQAGVVHTHLKKPIWLIIPLGFAAAFLTATYGGLFAYFRNSWRFALFFLFPFVLMSLGLAAMIIITGLPLFFSLDWLHLLWSAPLAIAAFRHAFLPWANRFSTILLFSNWQTAIDMATGRNARLNDQLDNMTAQLEHALIEPADEYLVSSHSMGGAMLIHCLGAALEKNPDLLENKTMTICSMGGAGLQCSLLKPATLLRARARLILNHRQIVWLDVQCLTDVVNFYTKAGQHPYGKIAQHQPVAMHIRMKNMLEAETYRRIKRDFLRVHRQFVMGSEQRSAFDFSLLTAGPFPTSQYAEFSQVNLPPLDAQGALIAPV